MDERATTFDGNKPHPVAARVNEYLRGLPWVDAVGSRMRDGGHVFHIEAFVIPADGRTPSLDKLE